MASLNTRKIRNAVLPPQTGAIAPRQFEPSNTLRTHEGAPAAAISPELALRRSVCSCLLWEDTFYESGIEIGARITDLARQVLPGALATLAYDARTHFNLRHVPLLLCAVLTQTGAGSSLVSETIAETIQRPDEITEFVSVVAELNGVEAKAVRGKLSAQAKKGLAKALRRFDRYQLAKYFSHTSERSAAVRARDVLMLTHPRAVDDAQSFAFKKILQGQSISRGGADTWETRLSAGKDKKESFTELLIEKRLGYLALLRNLRNMIGAGVDEGLIRDAIVARRGAERVLPFRYVEAARAAPTLESALDQAMSEAISELPAFSGKTTVLVDVSGSMNYQLSGRSKQSRIDAAAALAIMVHGDIRLFTFSDRLVELEVTPGLQGIRYIGSSQPHNGTNLGGAIAILNGDQRAGQLVHSRYNLNFVREGDSSLYLPSSRVEMDRLIVITDEQSESFVPAPTCSRAYMINVAPYKNGVGYGERWTHIDGFSEQVLRFIHEFEALASVE